MRNWPGKRRTVGVESGVGTRRGAGPTRTVILAMALAAIGVTSTAQQGPLSSRVLPFRGEGVDLTATWISSHQWMALPDPKGYRSTSAEPWVVLYKYDEQALMPDSAAGCYLDLYIYRRDQPDQGTRAWHERWELRVASGRFIDRAVPLEVVVVDGASEKKGTLTVHVHQPDALNAVQITSGELEVGTRGDRTHPLVLKNNTPFPIDILSKQCSASLDHTEARIVQCELPRELVHDGELNVGIAPQAWSAFWRSAEPYSLPSSPHDSLAIEFDYKVRNGGSGRLRQRIPIKYFPGIPLVILAVIAGALLSSLPRGLVTQTSEGSESLPAGGSANGDKVAQQARGKASEGLTKVDPTPERREAPGKDTESKSVGAKDVAVPDAAGTDKRPPPPTAKRGSRTWWGVVANSASVAVIAYLLYLFASGKDRETFLFGYHLDPTQCVPGFLLGVAVGLRPDYWYERLSGKFGVGRGAGGAGGALVAFLLSSLAGGIEARDFRPVAVEIDRGSGRVFVLSSPENVVYQIVGGEHGALVPLAQLDRMGAATDMCVGGTGDHAWFAVAIAAPTQSLGVPWRSSLVFGDLGDLAAKGRWAGLGPTFARYQGLACGDDGELLVTELQREEIRRFRFQDHQLARSGESFADRRLRTPTAILVEGESLFAADARAGTVVEARRDPGKQRVADAREIARGKGPSGLGFRGSRGAVLIADAALASILSYDRTTRKLSTVFDGPELQSPVDVAEDATGTLWVADSSARAVFAVRAGQIQQRLVPR